MSYQIAGGCDGGTGGRGLHAFLPRHGKSVQKPTEFGNDVPK